MESFPVNVDNPQEMQLGSRPFPDTTSKKRRFARLLGSMLVGTFLIGITCGYLVSHGHLDTSIGVKECPSEPEVTSSITHELEFGLDTIMEWFPESAAKMMENKNAIISHMVDMTDPAPDSKLQNLEIVLDSEAESMRPLAAVSSSRTLGRTHEADTSAVAAAPARPCQEAVTDFVYSVMQFVVGFARLELERQYAFRLALLSKLQKLSQRDFNKVFELILDFVTGNGTEKKVEAIWKFMRISIKDLGLGRFLASWVAAHALNPWDGIKNVVRMVSQCNAWFMKDTRVAFTSAAALQLTSGQDMLDAGLKARHMCMFPNRTRVRAKFSESDH